MGPASVEREKSRDRHPPAPARAHVLAGARYDGSDAADTPGPTDADPTGQDQKKWRMPSSRPLELPPGVVPGALSPCTPMDFAAEPLFFRKA